MEQGTEEWKQWRRQGIGGSDAPAILGFSDKADAIDIFLDKVYGIERPVYQWVVDWGKRIEAKVRARYSLSTDCEFPPALADMGIFKASADGWNPQIKIGIEIKGCGEEKAKQDTPPEGFVIQCLQNIHVFGAKHWILLRSHDGETIKEDIILPQKRQWGKYETKLNKFWERVQRVKALPRGSVTPDKG